MSACGMKPQNPLEKRLFGTERDLRTDGSRPVSRNPKGKKRSGQYPCGNGQKIAWPGLNRIRLNKSTAHAKRNKPETVLYFTQNKSDQQAGQQAGNRECVAGNPYKLPELSGMKAKSSKDAQITGFVEYQHGAAHKQIEGGNENNEPQGQENK